MRKRFTSLRYRYGPIPVFPFSLSQLSLSSFFLSLSSSLSLQSHFLLSISSQQRFSTESEAQWFRLKPLTRCRVTQRRLSDDHGALRFYRRRTQPQRAAAAAAQQPPPGRSRRSWNRPQRDPFAFLLVR